MIARTSQRLVASLALVLLGSTSVLAADAQAFGDRLKAMAAKSGAPVSFSSAAADGDNVILKGLTLGAGTEAANVGDITFENVTGSNAEGWKVERVPFADFKKSQGGKEAAVTGMVIEGLQIAGEGASTLPGEAQYFFDSAAIEAVKITEGGKDLFTLGGTDITNTVESGSGEISSNFTLGDFALDFAALPADESTKTMTELGYPQLSGSGTMMSSWNPKSGELSLDPFELTLKDAGKLSFAFQLNGYTTAFSKSLQQIQEQMAADPAGAENSGMAIIGLVSQLSIASMQIDFTDDSLTGNLLDYYAKQSGQTRDQLIDGLTGMLPGVLASLQNPEFQTEVTEAVTAFLKDPKSLTVSVDPDAPVAATQIIGAAMGAPQTLPSVLSLSVVANGTDE
jgi:hypothetical protein